MPELGDYTTAVLGAYGVSLALMAGLITVSLMRARAVRLRLRAAEVRAGRGHV